MVRPARRNRRRRSLLFTKDNTTHEQETPMASPGETTGPSGAQAADGSWAAHATRLSEEARDKAADILEPAQHKVREAAERQRAAGAERVDAVAKAVHEAADRIGAELPPQAAQYLHDAADRLD